MTFQNILIPVINKPTRVTKVNATLIDHILTNDFLDTASSTGIVKSDISDHFPILLITSPQYLDNAQNKATIRKREINKKSRQYFMEILNEVNWKHLYFLTDTNLTYEYFLRTFRGLYNHAFPIKEVSLKLKNVFSSWMTKGAQKSSKRKQKLYDKFLRSKTNENGKKYKTYKSLFEILNEKYKKNYYSRKLENCEQNMKKTWDTIKQVIGKTKTIKNDIPKRMVIDGIETFDQNEIGNGFNKYFTEIGSKLASSIPASSRVFKQFMNVSKTVLQEYTLQDQELEEAFKSHLLLNFAPVVFLIHSSIFLIFHCKLEFFQME